MIQVVSIDQGGARGRDDQCGQKLDQRRLTGSVWADQAKKLALVHLERNLIYSRPPRNLAAWQQAAPTLRGWKSFGQGLGLNGGGHGGIS